MRWRSARSASNVRPAARSTPTSAAVATGPSTAASAYRCSAEPADNHLYDVVITGGRVIDPETGFDRVADVGIDGRPSSPSPTTS